MQSDAFFSVLPAGSPQRLSMLRMGFVTKNEADTQAKLRVAYENHQRFVNVFTTPGTVHNGAIEPIAVSETLDDIRKSLIIGSPQECVDKLGHYADLGIHDIQVNMNFGANHADVMGSLERFAAHVMPHFKNRSSARAKELA
jgi:alkanesulfonate monooxygenase SsuD/methylene tetrahydromethanopterin reductase-like flavin-dependent oxidoreductase (luciferase family)